MSRREALKTMAATGIAVPVGVLIPQECRVARYQQEDSENSCNNVARINGKKIKEIKERIAEIEEHLGRDGTYEDMYHVLRRDLEEIIDDAELMVGIIDDIRNEIHYAEQLGTNNSPDMGVDNE